MVDMMPPRWNWRDRLPAVVVVDNVWLHERWYLNKCLGGVVVTYVRVFLPAARSSDN